ncbi:MAG: glycerate kinase [Firmicutes bacterium]|nr:glycerate kinase [Bacillota bacterium]
MSRIQKIVIACDSFKGSCSAIDVTRHLEEGLLRYRPDLNIIKVPVADGGEGTVDALLFATGGDWIETPAADPLGRSRMASFGLLPDGSAVLEMASASGLPLLAPEERNPQITSTYGTGQLIKAAMDRGCRKMILGIGGSATNDGGAGMAAALGAKFYAVDGSELFFGTNSEVLDASLCGGAALARLDRIDISGLDPRLNDCEIIVACDVNNPLCGERGASAIYGPQKGATPDMVKELDSALAHYADIVLRDVSCGPRQSLDCSLAEFPGAGAAGGLGFGLMAFCGAEIRSGIESVLDMVRFEDLVKDADLVITGEGAIDHQTLFGKVPQGVTERAKKVNPDVAVIGVAGTLGRDYEKAHSCGIDYMMSIATGPITLEQCMADAPRLLSEAGLRIAHLTDLLK